MCGPFINYGKQCGLHGQCRTNQYDFMVHHVGSFENNFLYCTNIRVHCKINHLSGERENPVTSLCKSPLANAVQVKYQVWQIYQYFIIIMIWDHQDVVPFMCNLFLVFHLFILTCCVWYFALCFLVLTSPKPGLLCLVWVLVVYSVKMTFRVSCFCFVCRNFSCSKWLCHIRQTPSLPAGVDSACTGEASGMLHRDILPAESPWISNLWKGSRRPKKNRVTGGQIRSWWMVGGKKNMSTSENMNLSPIFIRPLTSFWTTSWFFFSARRRCELKCLALFSGCFHSNSNNTRQTTWKQNHTSLTHLDIWLVDM